MAGTTSHQKVYAAGYYAGLEAAGVCDVTQYKIGDKRMNNEQFSQIHKGLSMICKKVYQAVLDDEACTVNQVCAEIKKSTGSAPDMRTASGCLIELATSGLIKETERGRFIRVIVKNLPVEKISKVSAVKVDPPKKSQESQDSCSITKLSSVSIRLLLLVDSIKSLASDIDTIALEIDDQIKFESEDTKKLKQLQQILKSLN